MEKWHIGDNGKRPEKHGLPGVEKQGVPAHEKAEAEKKGKPDEGCEKRIAELRAAAEGHKETLQRLQAEFENASKRAERERAEFVKFASAKTIQGFLPVIDSMEEAIKQAEKSGNKEMKEGVATIMKQMMKALEGNGVRRIEALGKKFDHSLHEVLLAGKDDAKGDDAVLEELQKGYTINGVVLRPAKVKVNRKE